jgi:GMP synthase PP-ATPase subunit
MVAFLDDGLGEWRARDVVGRLKGMGLHASSTGSRAVLQGAEGAPDPEEKRKAFRRTFYDTLTSSPRRRARRTYLSRAQSRQTSSRRREG